LSVPPSQEFQIRAECGTVSSMTGWSSTTAPILPLVGPAPTRFHCA
jgi:hypothetical protein